MLVQTADGAHRAENAERHRQVEPRAFLADVGGSQIDGDALVGVAEAGVDQSALDALAAFAHGHVGHADDHGVARVALGKHVHLNVDEVRVNAVYGGAAGFEEGHSGLRKHSRPEKPKRSKLSLPLAFT